MSNIFCVTSVNNSLANRNAKEVGIVELLDTNCEKYLGKLKFKYQVQIQILQTRNVQSLAYET